jgi:hypothetical protein
VDVALQRLRPLVLRRHDAPSRGSQVLHQPHVAQRQSCLRRDAVREPLLRGVHRIVGRHRQRDRAQQLALVDDGEDVHVLAERRQPIA